MTSSDKIPSAALILGCAGLIPFLAGTFALATGMELPVPGGSARAALVVYGVAILSFLGGVRWGLAMGYDDPGKAPRDYVLAVVPALIGWAAAGLRAPADLWTLAVAFLLLGLLDYGLICREVAPSWYGRFRLALSGVVTVCLALAATR